VAFSEGDEKVYENPDAFPRAFVVERARRFSSRGELLNALEGATSEELRSVAFLEQDVGALPAESGPVGEAATLVADSVDRVVFRVRSGAPAVLVVTDAYLPGWQATVNGRAEPVFPADDCFRGLRVPAGQSEVVLSYRPSYTRSGFLLAAAGVLVLAMVATLARSRS